MLKLMDILKDFKTQTDEINQELTSLGLDFSKYFHGALKDFNNLIYLHKDNINNKTVITEKQLNQIILMAKKRHDFLDKTYSLKIDLIDFDIIDITFEKLLALFYEKITLDYIYAFMYEWDFCEKQPEDITWEQNGKKIVFQIKSSKDLCDFLNL